MQPDVLCLQELKLEDRNFPIAEIEAAGYRAVFSGQKTYNGVAILARKTPAEISIGIPVLQTSSVASSQRRSATCG